MAFKNRSGSFRRGVISTAQTVKRLREIGKHVLQAAKSALKEGADLVVQDAKSRCPVKTGKLHDSIKAIPRQNDSVYEIEANARNDNGIPYGQFVEFDPKINNPFLYPAMDANSNEIRNKIQEAIGNAIGGK